MANTSQQIGGSVGTALLSTLFASAAAGYAAHHAHVPGLGDVAMVHGYTTAFWWAAGIFAVGLLLALVILPTKATRHRVGARSSRGRRRVLGPEPDA
jgi:hypothetical protein